MRRRRLVELAVVATVLVSGVAPAAADGTTAAFTGVVTAAETGAPLPDVCVGVYDTAAGTIDMSAPTGDDGVYLVPDLPPGVYQVAFQDCTQVPVRLTELFDDRQGYWVDSGEELLLGAGEVRTLDADLVLGGAITGRLTWAHSGAPAATCVGVYRALPPDHWYRIALGDFPEWGVCTGDPAWPRFGWPRFEGEPGVFVAPQLPVGDYVLSFADPADAEVDTWYGGDDRDTATVVHVGPGDRVLVDSELSPAPASPTACTASWPASARFDDVADDAPHAGAIGCLASLEIVHGTAPHQLSPAAPLTRGQAASMLVGALGAAGVSLEEDPPDAFDDDAGSPHEHALDQLAALGLLHGTAPRAADPNAVVTRGQLATLGTAAYETATGVALHRGPDHFTDDDGSVHEPAIDQAATAGIVTGRADGTFGPDDATRRDQATSVVERLLGRIELDVPGGEG